MSTKPQSRVRSSGVHWRVDVGRVENMRFTKRNTPGEFEALVSTVEKALVEVIDQTKEALRKYIDGDGSPRAKLTNEARVTSVTRANEFNDIWRDKNQEFRRGWQEFAQLPDVLLAAALTMHEHTLPIDTEHRCSDGGFIHATHGARIKDYAQPTRRSSAAAVSDGNTVAAIKAYVARVAGCKVGDMSKFQCILSTRWQTKPQEWHQDGTHAPLAFIIYLTTSKPTLYGHYAQKSWSRLTRAARETYMTEIWGIVTAADHEPVLSGNLPNGDVPNALMRAGTVVATDGSHIHKQPPPPTATDPEVRRILYIALDSERTSVGGEAVFAEHQADRWKH